MSNQSVDGFQGSQPFITDKEYQNLSLDELKYILQEEKQRLKDNYKELGEKQKLIKVINKLKKLNEEVKKGVDILKTRKKSKPKKLKTFEQYFEECIKNKEIPPDTPSYLREALERAVKEYLQGIEKEKSAFENFAVKYIIEGDPGLTPVEYFKRFEYLKRFFYISSKY